jgi:hypothetical protein
MEVTLGFKGNTLFDDNKDKHEGKDLIGYFNDGGQGEMEVQGVVHQAEQLVQRINNVEK